MNSVQNQNSFPLFFIITKHYIDIWKNPLFKVSVKNQNLFNIGNIEGFLFCCWK